MEYFYEEFDCTQTCEFQEIFDWGEELKIKVSPSILFLGRILKRGALVFFHGSFGIQLSFGRMFCTQKKAKILTLRAYQCPRNFILRIFPLK
jgi:hypothetical protein